MRMGAFAVLLLCFCGASCGLGLRRAYPAYGVAARPGAGGEPLFLSPYIEAGRIKEGRAAARAPLPGSNTTSYAGFLTVDKAHSSNLFFWFIPAEVDPSSAPVVLWLQGGPGASSLFGLFCEHGPFFVDKEGNLKPRKYTWAASFNMIYIDSPVGTGFSFTKDPAGYARDETDVGRDLYSALSQFFQLFPSLRKNDFFVTGESYGGKYVPATAHTIHTNNLKGGPQINLKGLAIGNGWTAPEHMLNYGDYLYEIGLIDDDARQVFQESESETLKLIQRGDYLGAGSVMDELINGDNYQYGSFFYNVTGFQFYFNYLQDKDSGPYGDLGKYLDRDTVRRSIHVGSLAYQDGSLAAQHLTDDIMRSAKPWIETLIDNYRVLFYNGQLDIICSYPLTVNVIRHLNWSGAGLYKSAKRRQWRVDGELAGYSKTVKGFTEVLVRNAGHMVPNDQPKWALDLITRFVHNKPF